MKAARTVPRRLWEAFGLVLLFVAEIVWASRQGVSVAVVGTVVGVYGIFAVCMVLYQVGQHVAYLQAAKWAQEVQDVLDAGQADLSEALGKLDALVLDLNPEGRDFQGPS